LFEYYEDFEEDIPFDPVAIRCDFTEYENFEAVQKDYKDIETLDQLRDNTIVLEVPNTKKLVIMGY
jgi:ubiquitin C-terminal hydrolase